MSTELLNELLETEKAENKNLQEETELTHEQYVKKAKSDFENMALTVRNSVLKVFTRINCP